MTMRPFCHWQHQQQQQPSQNYHTTTKTNKYAAVHHQKEYERNMAGPHGNQLELTYEEALGKDDAPFDPFIDYDDDDEEEEEDDDDGVLEEYGEDVQEAEFKEINNDEDEDDEEEEEEENEELARVKKLYNKDGSNRHSKSYLHANLAGAPCGGTFAVIHLFGKQHKITKDDLLIVDKFFKDPKYYSTTNGRKPPPRRRDQSDGKLLKEDNPWKVGNVLTLDESNILLLGSSSLTLVGLPGVKGAEVDLMVEEITMDKRILVFKKRRRKNSKRSQGFRREVMFLRILDIRFPEGEDLEGCRERRVDTILEDMKRDEEDEEEEDEDERSA